MIFKEHKGWPLERKYLNHMELLKDCKLKKECVRPPALQLDSVLHTRYITP